MALFWKGGGPRFVTNVRGKESQFYAKNHVTSFMDEPYRSSKRKLFLSSLINTGVYVTCCVMLMFTAENHSLLTWSNYCHEESYVILTCGKLSVVPSTCVIHSMICCGVPSSSSLSYLCQLLLLLLLLLFKKILNTPGSKDPRG